jgi:translation initiation factor IF-3
MPSYDAIKKAFESGLDLVEVSPNSAPPVCRIMDFGKYKYEQSKKEHATKLHQRGSHLKEIKLRLSTGVHDLDVKIRHAREFLEEGNKVKVAIMFRGRERAYQKKGWEHMAHIQQQLLTVGQPEYPPKMEGNCLAMILVSKALKDVKGAPNEVKNA